MRTMSLERGRILCRLNQVLFPDPGRPMERMTAPFGFFDGGADTCAGANAADGSAISVGASASAASPVGPPGVGSAGACFGAWGLLPFPRRPRLRERCERICWDGSLPPLVSLAA